MLDQIDIQLVNLLQMDGRQSASDLAQQVGMSVPAVSERIRKLQEMGVILGFTAVIDPKQLGMDVGAYITLISERSDHYSEVIEKAKAHPEVLDVMSVTGEGSHLLRIRTENTATLEKLLGQIQSWPGVTRTETRIILSAYKEHSVIPVAESMVKPPVHPKGE
jgi:Lrp/AsnC family leucine-responsive transcriptional regulator